MYPRIQLLEMEEISNPLLELEQVEKEDFIQILLPISITN